MAQIPSPIIAQIKSFIDELERNQIHIQQAILFGSYASGKFNAWSDIDLALVSNSFEGERFSDRNKIRKIKLSVSSALEPIPYRPDDFTAADPFVKKILETGFRIV